MEFGTVDGGYLAPSCTIGSHIAVLQPRTYEAWAV